MTVRFLRIGKTEQKYIKVAMLGFLHLKPIISNQICLSLKVKREQTARNRGSQVSSLPCAGWYFFPKLFISSYLENKQSLPVLLDALMTVAFLLHNENYLGNILLELELEHFEFILIFSRARSCVPQKQNKALC